MSIARCDELGQIELLESKGRHDKTGTFCRHVATQFPVSHDMLTYLRNIGRTMTGIEKIDRSTYRDKSGKIATLVIIFKKGVREKSVDQTSSDLIHRVANRLNQKAQNLQNQAEAMAVYSYDGQ